SAVILCSAVTVGWEAHPTTKPVAWRWGACPPYGVFGNGKKRVGNKVAHPTTLLTAHCSLFFCHCRNAVFVVSGEKPR
ncbi:MAG: hypothetical protein IKZ88_01170, partial [Neisseriaceae bacterium]|nr:hypothetical protein [Neisseriaceae bacterium]